MTGHYYERFYLSYNNYISKNLTNKIIRLTQAMTENGFEIFFSENCKISGSHHNSHSSDEWTNTDRYNNHEMGGIVLFSFIACNSNVHCNGCFHNWIDCLSLEIETEHGRKSSDQSIIIYCFGFHFYTLRDYVKIYIQFIKPFGLGIHYISTANK